MITTKETHHCDDCFKKTTHVVVLVRDEELTQKERGENKLSEFLKGFIKSSSVGAFEASMDEFSRHSICEECGKKTINDNLT